MVWCHVPSGKARQPDGDSVMAFAMEQTPDGYWLVVGVKPSCFVLQTVYILTLTLRDNTDCAIDNLLDLQSAVNSTYN